MLGCTLTYWLGQEGGGQGLGEDAMLVRRRSDAEDWVSFGGGAGGCRFRGQV